MIHAREKFSRCKTATASAVIALALLIGACASFEPGLRLQELNKPRLPTAKAVQEGVEVAVEEFYSPAKSKMMFDADLASEGVIPVLVKVENNGAAKYAVRRSKIRVLLDGRPLAGLEPREAAKQAATSEYAGKALGWTLATGPFPILLWPVTIGASSVHTHGVNQRIEAYFEAASFQDALLGAKQTATGFLYFKRPDDAKSLEQLSVDAEVETDGDGKKLNYRFDLPRSEKAE